MNINGVQIYIYYYKSQNFFFENCAIKKKTFLDIFCLLLPTSKLQVIYYAFYRKCNMNLIVHDE